MFKGHDLTSISRGKKKSFTSSTKCFSGHIFGPCVSRASKFYLSVFVIYIFQDDCHTFLSLSLSLSYTHDSSPIHRYYEVQTVCKYVFHNILLIKPSPIQCHSLRMYCKFEQLVNPSYSLKMSQCHKVIPCPNKPFQGVSKLFLF